MPTFGKVVEVVEGLDCTASKTKAKLDAQANFPRWRPLDWHADAGREAHQKICHFLIVETCSIFFKVCLIFDVGSMLIMVCYFKKICGINQAEDRVTWPDLLHRYTSQLASFREWSVVSARLRIRAQPQNPCQPRNSASGGSGLANEAFAGPAGPTIICQNYIGSYCWDMQLTCRTCNLYIFASPWACMAFKVFVNTELLTK